MVANYGLLLYTLSDWASRDQPLCIPERELLSDAALGDIAPGLIKVLIYTQGPTGPIPGFNMQLGADQVPADVEIIGRP